MTNYRIDGISRIVVNCLLNAAEMESNRTWEIKVLSTATKRQHRAIYTSGMRFQKYPAVSKSGDDIFRASRLGCVLEIRAFLPVTSTVPSILGLDRISARLHYSSSSAWNTLAYALLRHTLAQ